MRHVIAGLGVRAEWRDEEARFLVARVARNRAAVVAGLLDLSDRPDAPADHGCPVVNATVTHSDECEPSAACARTIAA
jgi:hypothetical protein